MFPSLSSSMRMLALPLLLCGALVAQPDVIVGDITGPSNYSTDPGYDAFSLGTTSCNIGTSNLTWISSTNQHPVIGGNLYKYDSANNGRFTMVGMSWLKHGFGALQQNLCGSCSGSGNFQALGVGCSDPYTSSRNGGQSPLGPRSQVNASTGFFPYPPANPSWSGNTDRRLKVPTTLLDTGSVYVAEAQYIQPEDAGADNDDNNASYRLASMSGGPANYSLSFSGPTVREQPAINAWAALDPGVVVDTQQIAGADGGLVSLGVKRIDNGNGTFHFEVCLHNLNAHDALSGVAFNFASGVTISNQGFHAPEWHSNETYNNNAWLDTTTSTSAVWMVDGSPASAANMIRWGTSFSFWFDATDSDILSVSVDLDSGGSISFGPPPFPTEAWETNDAAASLAIDGNSANDPFVGPIQVSLATGVQYGVDMGGASGLPFELYLTGVGAVPSFYVSADDEIVNLNVFDPSFFGLFGGAGNMPAGGNLNFQFNLPSAAFYAGQVWSVTPASVEGFSLSAATELDVMPLPRVVVECNGGNSYTANPDGFWRVTHTGTTPANITSVVLSFAGATGPANGVYFDTDQGMPSGSGSFNQGQTYEQNSDVTCGLDYSVSAPYPGSGWIGSSFVSGASLNTVEFRFTGGQFNGNTFRFNADTDPGTQGSQDHIGMNVTVTMSNGDVLTGVLGADPTNPNRSVIELQ